MNFNIPEYVNRILVSIQENGFEAYIVGGAARDLIMGRVPKDWDIATNARPDSIKKIFDKTVDTGIKHGTVTVLIGNDHAEVTTYRTEAGYSDFRRPDSVEFVNDLKEDLQRRDFTINALAYNLKEGLKDLNNGLIDIKEKIIRCVGNPEERFCEDALRMMRAVRFACELGFAIETSTLSAIQKNAKLIKNISSERIREELNKILICTKPSEGIRLLDESGLLIFIMPELSKCQEVYQENPHHIYDVYNHILKSVDIIKPELHLRLTMLLHDLGKPYKKTNDKDGIGHFYGHDVVSAKMAEKILERLKYDNKISKRVITLVRWHDLRVNTEKLDVKKSAQKVGLEYFKDYFLVRAADINAQNLDFAEEKLEKLKAAENLYYEIEKNNEPMSLNDLKINGNDLINIGIKDGKKIGETLDFLMEKVLEKPEMNFREELIRIAKDNF